MRRTHYEIPEPVTGYELEQFRVCLLRAREARNIVENPSVETGTTGYTAVGGSIARTATKQRRGAYSLQVTPTSGTGDGVYYGTVSLTAGTIYFLSVDVLGAPGVPYKLYFGSTAGAQLGAAYVFRGTGRWQRLWIAWEETSTTTRRLYLTKDNHASTRPFYLDGLQVEADRLTTYLDGDMRGFIKNQTAYYWTGVPHASPSVRIAATRHGGEEVNLRDLGFRLTAIIGLGLSGFTDVLLPNASLGGSQYQRTVKIEQTFDLVGTFLASGSDPTEVRRNLQALNELLRPKGAIVQQPVTLRIYQEDAAGRALAEPVDIPCLPKLESNGNVNNDYAEQRILSFTTYLPFMGRMDGSVGASLDFADSLTMTAGGGAVYRDVDGVWHDTTAAGEIYAFLLLPDGTWLMGGDAVLYQYNPATGAVTDRNGGAISGEIFALALMPDNDTILVGGLFSNASGIANADNLVKLSFSTWTYSQPNATPLSSAVFAIQVLPNGNAAIGGAFQNAGGDGNADYLAQVNGSTYAFSSFNATPLNQYVISLALDVSGTYLYFSGGFTNAGGDANADYVARMLVSSGAYSALTTSPLASDAWFVRVGPDNTVYVAGGAGELQAFNGTAFETLGTAPNNDVLALLARRDGTVMLGGLFSSVGGVSTPDGVAVYNGSVYLPPDIDFAGTLEAGALASVMGLADSAIGELLIGGDIDSPVIVPGVTTVTNPGSADAYPILSLKGPGGLVLIRNQTTGDSLFFNLTLIAGETATLETTPGKISFRSNLRPQLIGTIRPGSSQGIFRLVPGENVLHVLMLSTDSNTRAELYFQPAYDALEDALYE